LLFSSHGCVPVPSETDVIMSAQLVINRLLVKS
jgi:hypothetical protein